jgi:hypothetical protein
LASRRVPQSRRISSAGLIDSMIGSIGASALQSPARGTARFVVNRSTCLRSVASMIAASIDAARP